MTGNGTQAIDRAAELLSLVVLADGRPGFGDLVQDTGLAKSTASRLLQALERHRLVHRDDRGGYVPGALFALYASRHEPLDELISLARPTMQQLNDATGETVNLAVARNNTVVQVAQIDSTFLLGTVNWVDVDVPAHCSALGKLFYAAGAIGLPTSQLERRTEHTITDPAQLARQLEQIRSDGYAVTLGELEIGLDAIAVPVHGQLQGRPDQIVAAIGISGPSDRIHHRLQQLSELLKRQAAELSGALGHPGRVAGDHTPNQSDDTRTLPSTPTGKEGAA
ncbi:MAG TPA: IclR family transcriptional regulator [Nocardioidaceae bacterium]